MFEDTKGVKSRKQKDRQYNGGMACLHIVVSNTYCIVFLFCFACLRPACSMFPVFLDCPFLIAHSILKRYADLGGRLHLIRTLNLNLVQAFNKLMIK
jgi:hypothetical protein